MGTERRVFGPPGTGKTTWIARQIALAVDRYSPSGVLVSSFTRAAAREIASRGIPVDSDMVGTLHALCYRALGRPSIAETKLPEWDEAQPHYLIGAGSGASDLDDPYTERVGDGDGAILKQEYDTLRARLVPRALWPVSVLAFAAKWEAWKAAGGLVDFTDMIELALGSLDVAPGAPSVAFFDEIQDSPPLQLALIRKWAEHMDYVVLAGDADQCIYNFIGASPRSFLEPPIPEEQKYRLRQSYRLPHVVCDYSQRWIASMRDRDPVDVIARDFDGSLEGNAATWKLPERIVAEVVFPGVAAGQSTMLLASCSYMLEPIKSLLRDEGIPFHNPYRVRRGDWNPMRGGADRLAAFLAPSAATWGERAHWWLAAEMASWVEMIRADGVLRRGQKTRIEREDFAGEAPWELLEEVFEPQALMDVIDAGAADPGVALTWLEDHLLPRYAKALAYALKVARKRGPSALREEPKVILGTIHSVKGGEADTVVLFPDLSHAAALEESGDPDPIRRVFYVGMTRARERLVLCDAAGAGAVRWL